MGVCYCGYFASSIFLQFLPCASSEYFLFLLFSTWGRVCRGFFVSRLVEISPCVLVVRRVVAGLSGLRWEPLWVPWVRHLPFFLVFLEFFVVVGHSELSFYILAFFIPICGLLAGLVFWPFLRHFRVARCPPGGEICPM